ncbi:glycosyltransferase family 25 protein [Martelella limonii]|uniref:glycosyltransferase family 25 protein n=1 Tax=Martelella limonii TaxID=1647649 RepID=UPI0015809186
MLVYIINLPKHTERRKHLAERFAAAGLEPIWVEAVDGHAIADEEIAARAAYPRAGSYALSRTQYGCYLSHLKCWQAFLATDQSHAAIFEDDIHLGEGFGSFLHEAQRHFPADGDLVKLETCLQLVRMPARPISKISDRDLYRLASRHLGAAAYIVSRKGARKLEENSDKFSMGVDAILFNPRPLLKHPMVAYQVDPAICIQDDIAYRCGLPQLGFSSANPVPKSKRSYGTSRVQHCLYLLRDSLRRLKLRMGYLTAGCRKRLVDFR